MTAAAKSKEALAKQVAKAAAKPVEDERAKPAAKISTKRGGKSGSDRPAKRVKAATPRVVPRRPTHKLRLRALANRIKSKLLGDAHDPSIPQAQELVLAATSRPGNDSAAQGPHGTSMDDAPFVNERTFESWWRGDVAHIWVSNLEACDRVAKGSSLWLNNSYFGEPVQRHLDALDARCDDRMPNTLRGKRGEAWLEARMELMDKCLQAADRCWSVFSYRAVPGEEALALMAQVAPGGTIPTPSFTYAPPAIRADAGAWSGQEDFNGYMYEAHDSARLLHNASAKFGLMRFLLRLGAARAASKPWWYAGWVFELASLAAMAQFFAVFGPAGSPESNVGEDLDLIAAVSRVFFDHDDGTITPLVTDLPRIAQRLDLPPGQFIKSLTQARRDYYAMLADLGISFDDVYAFAKPVEVMGATTIGQNMIWRGRPPEGWQS
jgi:hypothetical protein